MPSLKKTLFAALAALAAAPAGATAADLHLHGSPFMSQPRQPHFGPYLFANHRNRQLPAFQAAPWYLYWPYDGHFMTPAPVHAPFYGPPTGGNFPVNPYFPAPSGYYGPFPGGPAPGGVGPAPGAPGSVVDRRSPNRRLRRNLQRVRSVRFPAGIHQGRPVFAFALVVCLAGIFCLAPLALYLLWLTALNKKRRPTVVTGGWDFAALCGGLSGFVVFGGGLLLSLLQSNVRYVFRGNFEALRTAWAQEQLAWIAVALGYLLVVVGGGWVTLTLRRRSLVVYNVEPGAAETAVAEVFDQLGRPLVRTGNLWSGPAPLFELEAFPAGRTVSIRWVGDDDRLFEELLRQLRPAVADLAPVENPAARWLTAAAVGILVFVVFFVGVLVTGVGLVR